MKGFSRSAIAVFIALGVAGWTSAPPSESVLFSAADGSKGGIYYAGLSTGNGEALYGTTDIGGTSGCNDQGCGTVFELTPPTRGQTAWVKSVLHDFSGADGANPQSRLITGSDGVLYGTTVQGGADDGGTVFKLAPPAAPGVAWKQTLLHGFAGGHDGFYPSGLTADMQGALYGTTQFGGSTGCGGGCGTVFKLAPPADGRTNWTETVLYRFQGGNDGANPLANLIADANGALYGTTPQGGGTACNGVGCGVVFKLIPPADGQIEWTEAILYRFQGGSDGATPYAGLIASREGALYGTTTAGGSGSCDCGAVFKLAPPVGPHANWTETLLYSFQGGSDGGFPNARLTADRQGAIYGSTNEGGDLGCFGDIGGCGTVFKLTPPTRDHGAWTESVLHRFSGGSDGAFSGELLVSDSENALYAAAASGGGGDGCGGYGCGVVFKIDLGRSFGFVPYSSVSASSAPASQYPDGGTISPP